MFLALNHYEIQESSLGLDSQAYDARLVQWQKDATESVLYFDDGFLMTAELNPTRFLCKNCPNAESEACLSNVHFVDVAGSGYAVQSRGEVRNMRILNMCQHRKNSQVFATCHDHALIIWSWNGTDIRGTTTKQALVVDSCFVRDNKEIMYGMFFLTKLPESVAEQGGHVLVTLTGLPNQPWMTIRVVTVLQPDSMRINFQMDIAQDGSLLEAAQSGKLIFELSHSENLLIVAGTGSALFFEMRSSPNYSVELVKDLVKEFQWTLDEHGNGPTISSCLALAAPSGTGCRGALDWIVLGHHDGGLFGFLWVKNQSTDRMELADLHHCGRFPSKPIKHSKGIPVGLLLSTYGSTPHALHKALHADPTKTSWGHLKQVACETDRFFSLGDNGKLLHWNLLRKVSEDGHRGWMAREENWTSSFLENGKASTAPGVERQILAAHSSRLVPNLLVLVDQRSRRISCVDTMLR